MSLTRFLPTPSDRMGILWSLIPIEESVILEYGPSGTTHYSMGLFRQLGENQMNHLFTTHMREEDVVMGDVKRLEKAIVEIDRTISPKVIFIVASSVAAVIGTDIKGVCTYMQEKVKARLITFEQGGFRGDFTVGVSESCKMLINEIVEGDKDTVEKDPNVFNIVGLSMGTYRAISDVAEISYLLEKGFGLKLGANLCGETDISKIEKAGNAAINIVLREEGLAGAKLLEKRFGTPSVLGSPYGYKGTLMWLEQVSAALGRPLNPALRMEIMDHMRNIIHYPILAKMLDEDIPTATLIGEYRTILGISAFLSDVGIKTDKMIVNHSTKYIEEINPAVTVCNTEKEKLDILKDVHRNLILGDDASMSVCPRDNVFMRISQPIINGAQIARHIPLMGLKGADLILESVEEYYQFAQ